MNDQDIRRYQMFTRVRDFGAEHADAFPAKSLGAQKFTDLNAVIAELDEQGATQSSGKSAARTSAASKGEARAALREQMDAISRTAARISSDSPGSPNNFRLPRSNGDQELLNTARAFAQEAAPLKAEFTKREMPAGFIDDLNAAIDDFEQAVNSRNLSTTRRITATAAIDDAIERGLNIVRDMDPIIRNKFRDDPATLAAWTSASHVERNGQKKSEPEKPRPVQP